MSIFKFKAPSLLVSAFALLVNGAAQQPCYKVGAGKVSGHLSDIRRKSGIAKATIPVKGDKIIRKVKSDLAGDFEVCIPLGLYQVRVEKYGYKRYIVKELKVTEGNATTVHLEMEHGWASDDPTRGKWSHAAPPNKRLQRTVCVSCSDYAGRFEGSTHGSRNGSVW